MKFILLVSLSLASLPPLAGQTNPVLNGPPDASGRIWSEQRDPSGVVVAFQLFLPKGYDKSKLYPLVLCLHGAGHTLTEPEFFPVQTTASSTLLKLENRAAYPAFLLIPHYTTGWPKELHSGLTVYHMDDKAAPAFQLVRQELSDVMKSFSVDPDRVYVTGESGGGLFTWDFIARYPDLFAAAIPICGIGDLAQAGKIRCPVWAFAGANDDIVPPACSRDMVAAVQAAGGNAKYTEFPGVGHNSGPSAWALKDLLPWLFSQQRGKK